MKAYNVTRVDQIPDGAMADIVRAFKVNGRAPTDQEKLDMYRAMLVNAGAR